MSEQEAGQENGVGTEEQRLAAEEAVKRETRSLIAAALVEYDGEAPQEGDPILAAEVRDVMQADLLASRMLRALETARQQQDYFSQLFTAEMTSLAARFKRLTAPVDAKVKALEDGLYTLAKQVPFPKGSRSRKVAAGSYGLRTKPSGLTATDEPAVIAWARAHLPAAVTRTEKTTVAAAALTKHFRDTGEVPEGCEVRPESETLSVTFASLEGGEK